MIYWPLPAISIIILLYLLRKNIALLFGGIFYNWLWKSFRGDLCWGHHCRQFASTFWHYIRYKLLMFRLSLKFFCFFNFGNVFFFYLYFVDIIWPSLIFYNIFGTFFLLYIIFFFLLSIKTCIFQFLSELSPILFVFRFSFKFLLILYIIFRVATSHCS